VLSHLGNAIWPDLVDHAHFPGLAKRILIFPQVLFGGRINMRISALLGDIHHLTLHGQMGILYSITTISGPPLAILFNNQGLVKNEFRAGLALVRVAESSVTAIVYYQLGLFIVESENILLVLIPSVLVGIPFGAYLLRRVDAETFRRICMSFDAWVVGFGLSRVLMDLHLMESPWAYSVMVATILIDSYLLYIFFIVQRPASSRSDALRAPLTSSDQGGGRGPMTTETTKFAIALISTHLGYYPVCMHGHETNLIKKTGREQVASRNGGIDA